VLVAADERGLELARGRISGNSAFGFAQFFARLEGKSKVVVEACWNWGRIHDLLEEIVHRALASQCRKNRTTN
jgi:hypothetical protein